MAEQRFCFKSDDDGHTYLVPADKREQFDRWLEHQTRLWEPGLTDAEFKKRDAEYAGDDFNEHMVDGHERFTFTDPREA